jgi:hypothetical protein
MVRNGGKNIAGVEYVRMVFAPDIMRALPCSDIDGFVYVKGTVDKILHAISEAKGADEGQ